MISQQSLITYAQAWIGTPYIWGGDDHTGFDCSGFVLECLTAVGLAPAYDVTAHGLYKYLKEKSYTVKTPRSGDIIFYGDINKIHHVAICIDYKHIIEAGGGDSKTINKKSAARDNAFVRIRPFNYRNDIFAILTPKDYFPDSF